MRKQAFIIFAASLGLAACGGIGTNYAEWYDPQAVKTAGPVDVGVVGAQPAVATAVADAMRHHGVQIGDTVSPGTFDPHYRVTVAYGPIAKQLADADEMDLCKRINGQGDALPAPATGSSGSTPVVAILCYQNWFQSVAYGEFPSSGGSDEAVAQAHAGSLIAQVFPAMNWIAYDNANRG